MFRETINTVQMIVGWIERMEQIARIQTKRTET